MENNLINICYSASNEELLIRTFDIDEILYFSLSDIFVILNKENRNMGERNPTRFIPNLIISQLKELENDEYIQRPHVNPTPGYEYEIFVTQPGLNRVMGNDSSPAGRKFQRWLYHEVVPSLTKHGVYPPPKTPQGSALSQMAEILAQNSRALADAIVRQDKLEQEVSIVKSNMNEFDVRVNKLEKGIPSNTLKTIRDWFNENNYMLSNDQENEMISWCANYSFKNEKYHVFDKETNGLKSLFNPDVICECKKLLDSSKG